MAKIHALAYKSAYPPTQCFYIACSTTTAATLAKRVVVTHNLPGQPDNNFSAEALDNSLSKLPKLLTPAEEQFFQQKQKSLETHKLYFKFSTFLHLLKRFSMERKNP